ncbi:tRNA pseudouridine(55) synthase TruB [Psychromicrobium xiongbiense]|uniref:tRNA pseudouridine(55) synthase TruB n=1 Tax=Psychromicrobium xiongbiense TaxID=3051184 RepID=UPI0025549DC9|nr:tRNA pseudouridine(55) synthase TruB [Psychromicrobium sp. YIM S02556]
MVSGLIIVDKPQGWTSHDVVAKLRRLAGTRKVGHAGTLDPMATGVLVIGLNKATRLLTFIVGTGKSYDATIRLGQSTVTDDAEGEVTASHGTEGVTEAGIQEQIAALTGAIEQIPSSVSAIKVNGERSYARVRSGEEVVLAARPVRIDRFEVHSMQRITLEDGLEVIDLTVSIDCSSGTYIRALARDLGRGLGVGGHLTALRRTAVGPYTLEQASSLTQLEELREAGSDLPVLELGQAARQLLPVREVTAEEAIELSFGRRITAGPTEHPATEPSAAFDPEGRLVALLEDSGPSGKKARAILVLQAEGDHA